jgi:monovalent cation:H+ antiporter, CPA1 family
MPSVEFLITGFLAIVIIALFVSAKAKLPYTVVLVLVGIFLVVASNTLLVGLGPISSVIAQIKSFSQQLVNGPNGGLFVGLVVPPLLFEAMMHISSKDLKAILRPAIILATVGVVVATIVGGLVLWLVAGIPLIVSLLFAAVISPTDTATVLEIFRRIHVPQRLAALLDTEAAFNDATGIVIFSVVVASITTPVFHLSSTILSFALILGGGLGIGFAVSFVAEILIGAISDRISAVVMTVSAVYGSYALATSLSFSGLVAVAVVGLYFGNFTLKSVMGATTREFVRLFWEIAAFLGNTIAFLFIGFRISLFQISAYTLVLILLAYLAVIISRAASVYPILAFLNRFGRERVPYKWRNVAMLGGMRGALSIALAASIATSTLVTAEYVNEINAMVLGVALISITIQAGVLTNYARKAFPQEQEREHEKLTIKLAKARSAIELLQKMYEEGKISESEFAEQLEKDKDELTEVLSEINSKVDLAGVAKTRASELYSSVRNLRNSNVISILRRHAISGTVEKAVEGAERTSIRKDAGKEQKDG